MDDKFQWALYGCWEREIGQLEAAARAGDVPMLRSWRGQFLTDPEVIEMTSRGGSLSGPAPLRVAAAAAERGHVAVLESMIAAFSNLILDYILRGPEVCAGAARGGQLQILKWLQQWGFEWDSETCRGAAGAGHLEILQWARTRGCPWDWKTCQDAAAGGHLEVRSGQGRADAVGTSVAPAKLQQ